MSIKTLQPEARFEQSIIDCLVHEQGYKYISPAEMKQAFNKKYAFDEVRLLDFIRRSQPDEYEKLQLDNKNKREEFFQQLDKGIATRGIIDVLKNGIKCYPSQGTILFYHELNPKRPNSFNEFALNTFAVTNQLTYSAKDSGLELDLAIFINGLPIITMELKSRSSSTGWNYKDAEEQYKNTRSKQEALFNFKRCMAHFAVDENYITFTTKLDGKETRFMPFNKGTESGGAGNPVNKNGIMTDYLWKEILSKTTLTNLIRDFVYVAKETLIFPRYHQLRVVNNLVQQVQENGAGQRYLIQHSAGSGKSNSITWLAYRLVEAEYQGEKAFDSVIVVTDRRNLDKQITDNIRRFNGTPHLIGHADDSNDLKRFLSEGKKIIITTIQKFPFLLDKIGSELQGRKFAIIIDEAHSSQSGKGAASLNMSITGMSQDVVDNFEDKLNEIIEARKMPENASFFAFTATPKAKTLQMFGEGKVFDLYSMKQAIEEGFILDVLKNYTTYDNFYKIYKTVSNNPEFDSKKGLKKIHRYVQEQEFPIHAKSEVIVEHFLKHTIHKINGKAKAMVVTASIDRAIEYYHAIQKVLQYHRRDDLKVMIAFSGDKEYNGQTVSEKSLNGFGDNETAMRFKEDKYKFLVVADKYQTGYDEPLLHTMYVDKALHDVKAVQTLSRLNRSTKNKYDTCVIDFANSHEDIAKAFQPYYKETTLNGELDPNKLHNILYTLDSKYVYEQDEVESLVESFLNDDTQARLNPILDTCVKRYTELSEEDQVEFKGGVKAFIRAYNFIASILPIGQAEWEKKVIFFELLIHRLPTPAGEDFTVGILDSVDLQSYRLEKQKQMDILLEDVNGEVTAAGIGATKPKEVAMSTIETIIQEFNDNFGDIEWNDKDAVVQNFLTIRDKALKVPTFVNACQNADEQNLKLEFDKVMGKIMFEMLQDSEQFTHQYVNNAPFKNWTKDAVFALIQEYLKHEK